MRYNLVSPRPRKDGKTYWHNIGSAFDRDKGGFSLVFDSLPLPDAEGRVTVLMTEPLPDRDEGDRRPPQRRDDPPREDRRGQSNDPDDSIPF